MSMNNCVFTGKLGRDPEIKEAGGTTIAKFSLAVGRNFKRDGQPDTDWVNCTAFGKTAEFVGKWFKKGQDMAVVTHVQMGSYEKDGKKIYTTDFMVDQAMFNGGKAEANDTTGVAPQKTKVEDFVSVDDDFDDIPF